MGEVHWSSSYRHSGRSGLSSSSSSSSSVAGNPERVAVQLARALLLEGVVDGHAVLQVLNRNPAHALPMCQQVIQLSLPPTRWIVSYQCEVPFAYECTSLQQDDSSGKLCAESRVAESRGCFPLQASQ